MNIIIIGGGIAGCESAFRLANKGIHVDLIEKESCVGGNVNNWYQLFPDRKNAGEVVRLMEENIKHPNITLHLNSEVIDAQKLNNGKFTVKLNHQALLEGDVLLLATGYNLFEAQRKEEYGYGIYENVITSVELENLFQNHNISMRNGDKPKRIGFIHCVGSRDEKICNFHCSKLCCITAVKQAIETRELLPDTEIFCFYMDMRMFGPGYEEMYREAQEKYNIKFIRGRLSEASENIDKQVMIKAEDTLIGKPIRMALDLMVLMVGMEATKSGNQLAGKLDLKLSPNGFIQPADPHYGNNKTNVEGIYIAGCCSAPMNITDTLSDARSAVEVISEHITK
ncbi:FAD-dependent oxidoreductase [Odoribacter sp. OttesenSCG-928-J03]|nr:FAD-dependent oxidoreductase [Odoribacter sp. OttesenSCG-928-J03]